MPLAVTLRLDAEGAAPIEALWRGLAEAGVDDDCLRLGYPPHLTLGIWSEEAAPTAVLEAAMLRLAEEWPALPVAFSGLGVFPGTPALLYAAPVPNAALLACHTALAAALPGMDCYPHYRPGHWVPHATLGQTASAARAVEVLLPLWPGPMRGRLDRLELVRFRPVEVLRSLALRAAPLAGRSDGAALPR